MFPVEVFHQFTAPPEFCDDLRIAFNPVSSLRCAVSDDSVSLAAIADHHERPVTGSPVQWLDNSYIPFTLIYE